MLRASGTRWAGSNAPTGSPTRPRSTPGPWHAGANSSTWGENVGFTSGDVDDLQRAFMNSPSHRSNLLDRDFDRVAVGAATDDRGRLYVTLFFCT